MMQFDQSQQNVSQAPHLQAAQLQHLALALQQLAHSQQAAGFGLGSVGQGVYGTGAFGLGGPSPLGAGVGWGGMYPQRQLSPHDVGAILQQIAPILPQIIAQAQQQQYMPQAAFGTGFGGHQRTLSPQDVSEVVRQIMPVIPQLLQSMQTTAWTGGFGAGQAGGFGQPTYGWGQAAYGQTGYGQAAQLGPFAQTQTRQLSPQDITEVARQLAELIPQAGGGQSFAQPRV